MQLFYIPKVSGTIVVLDQTESKHVVRVLRLATGSEVHLVDGNGGFYEAEITDANPKNCQLTIRKSIREFGKKNFRLHMAVAPTKNTDRFEWFLEKATEIGVDEITPLLSDHSERKHIKSERLEKILVSAMKQSVKAYLPKLNEMVTFSDFLKSCTTQNRFIAHCYEGEKPHLKNRVEQNQDVVILIGPEGDFSLEEVTRAKEHGFTEVSLGASRLRTETAAVAACHIINLINE